MENRLEKIILLFSLACLLLIPPLAGESELDRLLAQLETADGAEKGELLIGISRRYENRDSEKVIEYAKRALKTAAEIDSPELRGLAFMQMAMGHSDLGDQDRAFELLDRSLAIFDQLGDDFQRARVLNRLGTIHLIKNSYGQALENFTEALALFRQEGVDLGISDCLGNIGITYWYLGDYEKALKYYLECVAVDEKSGNRAGLTINLGNIAILYDNLRKFPEAEKFYFKAEELYRKDNDLSGLAHTYNNLGDHYKDLKDHQKALLYFQKSEKLAQKLKNRDLLAVVYSNMADIYLKAKAIDRAREQINRAFGFIAPGSESEATALLILGRIQSAGGEYRNALKSLERALKIPTLSENKSLKKDCLLEMSNIHKQTGDYRNAYDFYIRYSDVKNQLFNEESNLQLTRMQVEYDTLTKEKEIKLLKQNNEIQALRIGRQQILRNAFIIGFILVFIIFFLLLKKYFYFFSFWKRKNVVGHYQIMEKIASGGMGTVYKARNLMDKTGIFAIKVMREELFDNKTLAQRFKREASIMDQLDHPNIVKVNERGEHSGGLFIAMELLEGRTLAKFIATETNPPIHMVVKIMKQIVDVIGFIHKKGILHKDLKPDNIMLVHKENNPHFVKLLDFGLARLQTFTRLTETGMVVGSIHYLSPEQISGGTLSEKSDVYSIGIIFYELITGTRPFTGGTTVDIMKQVIDIQPMPVSSLRPDIPGELNDLIMSMLDKDPGNRPSTAVVSRTLADISAGES